MMETTERTMGPSKPKGLIPRAERTIIYMIDNQQYLYRGVVTFALIFNVIALFGLIKYVTLSDTSGFLYGGYSVGIFYPLVTVPLAILFARIARERLNESDPKGVTHFAIFLGFELVNGGYLVFVVGLYALLNKAFRRQWESDGPEWFQKLAQSI